MSSMLSLRRKRSVAKKKNRETSPQILAHGDLEDLMPLMKIMIIHTRWWQIEIQEIGIDIMIVINMIMVWLHMMVVQSFEICCTHSYRVVIIDTR